MRVIALALPGVLLVASTDPVRLADALTVHWRVSTRFAYGALAALRLVPLLATEWQTIRLARRARGVERRPQPARRTSGCSPARRSRCWSAAVRRGTRLATAMDARGLRLRHRAHQRPRVGLRLRTPPSSRARSPCALRRRAQRAHRQPGHPVFS